VVVPTQLMINIYPVLANSVSYSKKPALTRASLPRSSADCC
jgi:hypothetical protein